MTFVLGMAFICCAQNLQFDENGEFKIVQFTDIHYKWGNSASEKALLCINQVLDKEMPDFVVFTGDQVYSDSVVLSLGEIFQPIIDRKIPFATIFGNHDHQFDLTLSETYDTIRTFEGCVIPRRMDVESPDYCLPIFSSDSLRVASMMYFFDTHAGAPIKGAGRYAWLNFEQVQWYRGLSAVFAEDNDSVPLPSIAFMHIPLPEYSYATSNTKNKFIGSKKEKECCPDINTGMFAAFKEMNDVFAVFCGHDHDNDYVVNYYDILLAYGRFTGGNTVYNHLKPNGARVIVLYEGKSELETWIDLLDSESINRVTFSKESGKLKQK